MCSVEVVFGKAVVIIMTSRQRVKVHSYHSMLPRNYHLQTDAMLDFTRILGKYEKLLSFSF